MGCQEKTPQNEKGKRETFVCTSVNTDGITMKENAKSHHARKAFIPLSKGFH